MPGGLRPCNKSHNAQVQFKTDLKKIIIHDINIHDINMHTKVSNLFQLQLGWLKGYQLKQR